MARRDKIAEAARPFLEQGEQVQAAFPAQTASQWLALAGDPPLIGSNAYPCRVATAPRPPPPTARVRPFCRPTGSLFPRAASAADAHRRPVRERPVIGIFDSGVGGLSVLRQSRRL